MTFIVKITDVETKDCLGFKQLKNNELIEMTEDEFSDFLKPYIIDILTNDANLRDQLRHLDANENEEDTEDLNDLEELKRL